MVGKGSENLIRGVLALDFDAAGVEHRIRRGDGRLPAPLPRHQRRPQHALPRRDRAGLKAMRAQGLRLACVTNKPIAFALPLLAQEGPGALLRGGLRRRLAAAQEARPDAAAAGLQRFRPGAGQVVAIGDSSNDAEAARAAGCFVLTVPYGYNHGRPIHEIDSDGIVESLLEAATLIQFAQPHRKLNQSNTCFSSKNTMSTQTGSIEAWLWRRWQSWAK